MGFTVDEMWLILDVLLFRKMHIEDINSNSAREELKKIEALREKIKDEL